VTSPAVSEAGRRVLSGSAGCQAGVAGHQDFADPIENLGQAAERLLVGASVYREPVAVHALLFHVGKRDWAAVQSPDFRSPGEVTEPDAGPPAQHAGPPAEEAGPPAQDAGPPAEEAGPPAQDAGPPAEEAGPPAQDAGPAADRAGPPAETAQPLGSRGAAGPDHARPGAPMAAVMLTAPVQLEAGSGQAGRLAAPPYQPPAELDVLIETCAEARLLTVRPLGAGARQGGDQLSVFVARPAAVELQRRLAAYRRGAEITAAHRHAAEYWLWRVGAYQQDRRADVHDLLEARHHLLAADDAAQAEAVTQSICAQLHASGALDQEASLIRDTLVWLPHQAPRRASWLYQLGKIAQLQGDDPAALRRYRQALEGFRRLGDSAGVASVSYDLAILAHAGPGVPPAGGPDDRTDDGDGRPAAEHRPRALAATMAGRLRWPAMTASVLALVAGLLALVIDPNLGTSRSAAPRYRAPAGSPALNKAAALRRHTADWIISRAGPGSVIACDPVMCGTLRARGLPATSLLLLGPAASDPLGADAVIATEAVRAQFGPRLTTVYAPAVLARVGAGRTRIEVRAVAPDGSAAYRAQLTADLTARKQDAAQLLRNPRLAVSAPARRQLAAGLADSRLLITLAALTHLRPVFVVSFGGSAPGASLGMPLCSADIAVGQPARGSRGAGPDGTGFVPATLAFLRAQRPPFLASHVLPVRLASGQAGVRIVFSVPSPLGLLSGPPPVARSATPNKPATTR
jgi:hypothetical protein